MTAEQGNRKVRGVVYGRSLDFKPLPPPGELLASPIRLGDVEYVVLPRKDWRDQLRLFLQTSGLTTIPLVTRLRWQAYDTIDWLQGSLLGKGRGRRASITHPSTLLPAIEFMMGLPPDLDAERRMMHLLIGRGLIEYRKAISIKRERPMLFAKEGSAYFFEAFKEQKMLGRSGAPAEQLGAVQKIYNNFYFFKNYYIYSIISREPPESGNKLFSKFMRASFFLSTIQDDGTIAPKPVYRALPPKEHVVFLAKRDQSLQARLREDEALRNEMQQLLKYFRPLRSAGF